MRQFQLWGAIAAAATLLVVSTGAAADHEHHSHADQQGGGTVRSPDAPPPPGYERVAHEVVLFTVPGRMKYDVESFQVRPGAKVKLVLRNTDEMQHNLLICARGEDVTLRVARAAWELGTDALKKEFVPDTPLVLHHTRIVNPHQADTIYFTAPQGEGDYPYVCTLPGHAFTMKGVMHVGNAGQKISRAEAAARQGERGENWYHVLVSDRSRIVRCTMPDSSSRSIAVGLPGGINYCFDAQECYVRYGWFGAFLDAGPDRGRGGTRGGGANRPLGERFSSGFDSFPLRLSSAEAPPQVQFRGYRSGVAPVFLYTVEGHDMSHSIAPLQGKVGLIHTFEFAAAPPGPIRLIIDTAQVAATCDVGTFQNGTLTIAPEQARKFTVTVSEKQ